MRRLVLRLRGVAKFVRTACFEPVQRAAANFGNRLLSQLEPAAHSPATAAVQAGLPDHPSKMPLVSIIVLNRYGEHLHERMLRTFTEVNTYQPFEFIVVYDSSKDASLDVLREWERRFPLRCIPYTDNESYAFANNRAAEIASGELLLLLDSDVVFQVDVLPKMVGAIELASIGAVGLKHYPSTEAIANQLANHIGIRFHWNQRRRQILPYKVIPGPFDSILATMPARFPAVTGASLLCRRSDYLVLGGLHEAYFNDYEDVDFCLRVATVLGKDVICLNNYYLVHKESKSIKNIGRSKSQTLSNRSILQKRFGYTLRRNLRTSLLKDDGSYSGSRFTIGVSRDSKACRELATTLKSRFGWEVARFNSTGSAKRFDAILVANAKTDIRELREVKPHLLRIGWVSDHEEEWVKAPWLHDFEIVLTSTQFAADELWKRSRVPCQYLPQDLGSNALSESFCSVLKKALEGFRIGIKCAAPLGEEGITWGDYHFAYALKRALQRNGHCARVDLWPDWKHPRTLSDDVAIVLRGRRKYEPMGAQINLLWLISHSDAVDLSELETFDHVFVASESYADTLAKLLKVPVSHLLQCADADIFYPHASTNNKFEHEILFVGNSRGQMRQVVSDAISKNLPVSIFGAGWDRFLPPGRIAGTYIPNHLLHQYYAGAKIVLNDHWPDMEREGFISNRIFDVALSGGFVISRNFKGSGIFRDELVTYRDADNLDQLCRKWLSDEAQRRNMAERLRQDVLANHTFSHRANDLLEVIDALHNRRSAPPADASLSAPKCPR